MDKSSKNIKNNTENNTEKISLTFSKDKEQWSINKPEASVEKSKQTHSEPETEKSAPNAKSNHKVSIPLSRVPNCWKTVGLKMNQPYKMSPYIRLERPRPPIQPMRSPPASTNATKLRTYRHPVPTNTVRTIMSDQLDKGTPETRINDKEIKPFTPVRMPYIREVDYNTATHKLPGSTTLAANIRTETSKHLNNKDPTLTISTANTSIQTEQTFLIEEQDYKMLQIIKTQNITEKEIHILEVVKASEIKEDELKIQLEKIKKRKESTNNSDGTVIDVEKHFENKRINHLNLEKLIRQSEQNKNDIIRKFIALARLSVASRQLLPQPGTSTPETVTAQANSSPGIRPSAVTRDQRSTSEARTPSALETLSEIACAEKRRDVIATTPVEIENSFQPTIISNELLRGPVAKIPNEDSSAFPSLAPTTIEETYRNNDPCNDLLSQTAKTPTAFQTPSPVNSFARVYPERIEKIMTFQKPRARPNTDDTLNSNSDIHTQDKSYSKKRRATPDHHRDNITTRYEQINIPQPQTGTARPIFQELRQNEAVVQQPQQQELPMFQQIPVHVRQTQMRYAGLGRHDRSELHIARARKLQQQRAQYEYEQMRIQYEQNQPTTLNAPHIVPQQAQIPPFQLYPSEQMRQPLPSQMPLPSQRPLPSQMPIAPARRVFSTEEANIHGRAIQRGRNWHYPVFYDGDGNCWPRPHDFNQ